MSWAVGWDPNWKRDIGYGVPAMCDHPGCEARIDRGLSYVCANQHPFGGEDGCGLFFCSAHRPNGMCEACLYERDPFEPTPDLVEWQLHKLIHPSWAQWRIEHPEELKAMTEQAGVTGVLIDGKPKGAP